MANIVRFIIFTILAILLASPVAAGAKKFKNKDTAKNRTTKTWGTANHQEEPPATFSKDEKSGDTVIHKSPAPKEKEKDWYDKVIITIDPDVKWPPPSSTPPAPAPPPAP